MRHAWTFDKVYSSYITQGLDADRNGKLTPDELQDLAKENTTSLVDFDYFTVVKANGAQQAFGAPRDWGMTHANEEATLSYVLPLKAPAANKLVTVEIYDPSYFVAFSLAEGDAVTLAGAPKGCSMTISARSPWTPGSSDPVGILLQRARRRLEPRRVFEPGSCRMSVTAEPLALAAPAKDRLWKRAGLAFAAIAVVAGASALLVWILAPAAPPPRPARHSAPRSGRPRRRGGARAILAIQASFYRSLQAALAGLKESGAALWSLLALGFSYGVFHAAGPGHGKAVIAAYLVASERSLVRGFSLSPRARGPGARGDPPRQHRLGDASGHRRDHGAGHDGRRAGELRRRRAPGAVLTWRKPPLLGVTAPARQAPAG